MLNLFVTISADFMEWNVIFYQKKIERVLKVKSKRYKGTEISCNMLLQRNNTSEIFHIGSFLPCRTCYFKLDGVIGIFTKSQGR